MLENDILPSGLPHYQRIYTFLLNQISSGILKPGDRVLSEKELCNKFSVSRITAKKALEMLNEQGIIVRYPGKGSFVAEKGRGSVREKLPEVPSIGLILPDFGDSFGVRIISAVEESCRESGYNMILKLTRNSVEEENEALRMLSLAEGLLILPVYGELYNPEILKNILNKKPMVLIDRKMQGLAVPSVSTDNVEAAKRGVEYLLRLGHRHIAFYSGSEEHISTVQDRRIGFTRALEQYGIPCRDSYIRQNFSRIGDYPFYSEERFAADRLIVKEHLKINPKISAAFTASYSITMHVNSALQEMGLRIPEDFSIMGFDAPDMFSMVPFFTHLRQDEYNIGKKAIEILHEIINGSEKSYGDTYISAKLITGKSTASIL
jgi:DNA-binding LacI/PurR family transcriptional regulator